MGCWEGGGEGGRRGYSSIVVDGGRYRVKLKVECVLRIGVCNQMQKGME